MNAREEGGRRRLARLALAAGALAVLALALAPGAQGLALLLLILGHYVVIVVGLWLFVAHRGVLRLIGLTIAVAAALVVPILEIINGLGWLVATCVVSLAVAWLAARAALAPPAGGADGAVRFAPPPARPFVIMNPLSGGGKVQRFDLRCKAESLGAEVAMLEGPANVDVAELARKAVDSGADLLGVAAGDGTQALVAGVAADYGIPLLVLPAGTRNHFARDLGLDRTDPTLALDALRDGAEVRVDLGEVAGRPFVNNVSFGAYAAVVARPDYRANKTRVTLDVLPDLLSQHHGPRLNVRIDGVEVVDSGASSGDSVGPTAVLVSNNPYGTGDVAGVGQRPRLDGGLLGVLVISVANARQAAALVRGRHSHGVLRRSASEVIVDADATEIEAGIDGEMALLRTPVNCRVRPDVLRVLVPRQRHPVPAAREPITIGRLFRLAAPRALRRSGRKQ